MMSDSGLKIAVFRTIGHGLVYAFLIRRNLLAKPPKTTTPLALGKCMNLPGRFYSSKRERPRVIVVSSCLVRIATCVSDNPHFYRRRKDFGGGRSAAGLLSCVFKGR